MACRCDTVTELYGDEAEQYSVEHLHRDSLDSERFEERLRCPDTGRRWVLEWPERTERAVGPARLRVVPGA